MEMKKKTALSWSGGKDSCMTLDRLVREGAYEVACLITTVPREIGRTFGHGERLELIRAQAEALGVPVEFVSCSFESYTDDYARTLAELKERYGLSAVAFGDLFLVEHREWGTGVTAKVGLDALYPLWTKPDEVRAALRRFVESDYRAIVIRIRDGALSEGWLGRRLDFSFYEDILLETGVCPMGEGGEYHTFVYDGPLFRHPVRFELGEIRQMETTKRLELLPMVSV